MSPKPRRSRQGEIVTSWLFDMIETRMNKEGRSIVDTLEYQQWQSGRYNAERAEVSQAFHNVNNERIDLQMELEETKLQLSVANLKAEAAARLAAEAQAALAVRELTR